MFQVSVKTKPVSKDEESCLEFNIANEPQMCLVSLRISQFIQYTYSNLYRVGIVSETDIKNRNVRVKFMHPPYQSRSCKWPAWEDFCWVPNTNVIIKIDTSSLSTVTGRSY